MWFSDLLGLLYHSTVDRKEHIIIEDAILLATQAVD